ncbi:MAG: HAD family hydrolase [Oligosphaeraceae bacterium]|nr:HAD family hydrolase [Oligosphaeraceae bacterium]
MSQVAGARPCVFIDRDGTVLESVHYLHDPKDVKVPSEAIQGLKLLRDAGFMLILISNQSGIARGYFGCDDLQAVHERMCAIFAQEDITLDDYFYCPHAPDAECGCRKPEIGMLEEACRKHNIDLQHSVMVGDADCDMELANNFSLPGLLILTARTTNLALAKHICHDFLEAAQLIISEYAPRQ